jgi:Holliday junction DNA helicase RuvB
MFNNYIGQKKIILELESIVNDIRLNFSGINILLRGPAGCGKTYLAKEVLESLGKYTYQTPDKSSKYELIWNEKIEGYKFHFIDEIHTLKHIETLYPIMDTKKFLFIFASNEGGELPEAFISRCFTYPFSEYSEDELSKIVNEYAKTKQIYLEKSLADLFAKYSRGSPRISKNLFDRVMFIIHRGYYKLSIKGIISALNDVGIYDGGYTDLDMKYLKTLSQVNSSSLDSMSRLLRIDKNTVINEIEPFLMDKGHIQITSKGRKFIKW